MSTEKLFALVLSLAFLSGTVGLAGAQEKKAVQTAKAAAKAKTAEGMVKSVSDTSLVVEGKDKKEWTFAISGKVAESAKKLKAGDAVKVSFTEDGGKMMVSSVTAAKMEKKAANPCAAKKPANPCAVKK